MSFDEMAYFKQKKAEHPDAIILNRVGNYYEAYREDAVAVSEILSIELTRNENNDEQARFPHHNLDIYLPKLVVAGRRVGICDPAEDPKLTKKLAKRELTKKCI